MSTQSSPILQNLELSPATPLSCTLDGSYIDENFTTLTEQQKKIDRTLNFLKNFPITKKSRGRPPKVSESVGKVSESAGKNNPKIPEFINDNLKSFTNINELHPGVLLDHLIRINSFNKLLLSSVEALTEKYNELKLRSDQGTVLHGESNNENKSDVPNVGVVEHSERHNENNNLLITNVDQVNIKIDDVEQQTLSNVVLCTTNNPLNFQDNSDILPEIKKLVIDKIPFIQSSDISYVKQIDNDKRNQK